VVLTIVSVMNGPLVCFALLGKIPLTIGVVGHEGSTVVVVMNSLRLFFGKSRA
jgi:Cd2+/Zn2+-exporting ATPase